MALMSNAVTRGSLTEEQLDKAFSADRRSVDILSTDFDSSTEGSVGGDSSLWESSNHDDITGDESDDKSTQFSGSFLDCYEEQVNDFDEPIQAVSTKSSDSGTEGDDEGPAPRYELRSRTIKQCKPSVKHARRDDTSDEDDSVMHGEESQQSGRGCGHKSRRHGGGRAGRGGRS